jgi:hypothetical protein
VVVLVPPPPVAAGFLSQPVVNAARPQRTSNVQIFFINKSLLKSVGGICFAWTFAHPFYLKRSLGANLSRVAGSDSESTVPPCILLPPLPAPADNSAMEAEPIKAEPPKHKRRWLQFSLRTLHNDQR